MTTEPPNQFGPRKNIRLNRHADQLTPPPLTQWPARAAVFAAILAIVFVCTTSLLASAQEQRSFNLFNTNVQKRANGVLALMGYSVVPDLTSSSLSIKNDETENPQVVMIQVAGGFTISQSFPLYLEGGIAASRYDPTFVASSGTESRSIPFKWNSLSGTAGVGWDFPITRDLKFRPIVNFALGYVASDLSVAKAVLENVTDIELNFLDNGHLSAYGYGGSVMLDYERYRPNSEIDIELRYTQIRLKSFGGSADAVQGTAVAKTPSLYARYRAPTGLTLLHRPFRYVLEFVHTRYWGDQAGILGFDYLSSVGLGFELDSSYYDIIVTRTRLVGRYAFGNNVSGVSIGLAVSF